MVIGWDYLIDKLAADGVERRRAVAAFGDPRVAAFTGVDFGIAPAGERRALYRGFLRPDSIARAESCRLRHDAALRAAEEDYGVPASVVSAILHVETGCGRNTGRQPVFFRLARLAAAAAPRNVERNIARQYRGVPRAARPALERRVRERARAISAMFYPEVLALFRLPAHGIDPLSLRGSGSGAFGMPQFLPSSYVRFAVDGDGNGRVSLYDPADAIASTANYLISHGWRPGIGRAEQRRVIWAYNHSDPYIDTVLGLADRIEAAVPSRLSLARR